MRGLFEVFVVDPTSGEIVFEKRLLAADEAKARLKAAVQAKLDRDVDEYDIIVRKLGDVRAKKQVQEVRVVSEK